jgi:cell division protein FtsW (lipid II flippase)
MPVTHALLAAVGPASAALLLFAASSLIGYALIPARLRPPRSLTLLLASASVGTTVFGVASWISGSLLGTWTVVPLACLACLGAGVRAPAWWRTTRRAARYLVSLARANIVASTLLAVLLSGLVPMLLVPLVDSDGLRYHVALPKLYLMAGRVFLYPYDVAAAFPEAVEMWYLLGLKVAPGEVAKFIHALFFLGSLAALAAVVHRNRRTRPATVLAPILFAASPVALIPAAHAFTDHVALFHVATAVLLLAQRSSPLLIGAAVAGALTTKLTTAPVVLLVWVLVGVRGRSGARWSSWLKCALPVAIAFAPFALRNLAVFGDPIFPFGHGLLGRAVPGVSSRMVRFASFYHADVTTPLGISWGPGLSGAPADEWAGWHHLAGLFCVVVAAFYRPARVLLVPLLAYLPFGIAFRPPTRYLLPLLWSLAGLEALLLTALSRRRWWPLGVVAALPAGALAWHVLLTPFHPMEYVRGRLDRDAYIASVVEGYSAARYVNTLPPGGRVMAIAFSAPYYFDRPWIAEGMLNQPPLKLELARATSAGDVLAWLRSLDVRYLVVTPSYGGGTPMSLLRLASTQHDALVLGGFKARLRLLATLDKVDVYEVPAGP